jgi:Fe-S oxidoreductase
MADMSAPSFVDVLRAKSDAMLDACTRCGDCVRACPMVEPAGLDPTNAAPIAAGIMDLLAGGPGTADAERWTQVCTNSGKCIPACAHGINPRLMVNLARIASKAKQGEAAVRKSANDYFNAMGRGTRTVSRLMLPPETLARINPPLRAPGEYERPDIVFYTGCNVIKTPHIALLTLEVLDRLGVRYEAMGGTSTCCGIQQFKQGDAKTAGRVGWNTIERLARPGAPQVLSWCPSCQIQIGEVALPAYGESHGAMPFSLNPITEYLAGRIDELRPMLVNRVDKRVAIQERAALPGVMAAVKALLRAIPGVEVVELDVPIVSTQANHLAVLPKFRAELRAKEFAAAAEAGVTTFASVFHACHRELVTFQPDVEFDIVNFMELIGESMGVDMPDLYKRLALMGDVDAIVADTADRIAEYGMDLDEVRDIVARDMFGGKPPGPRAAAAR